MSEDEDEMSGYGDGDGDTRWMKHAVAPGCSHPFVRVTRQEIDQTVKIMMMMRRRRIKPTTQAMHRGCLMEQRRDPSSLKMNM